MTTPPAGTPSALPYSWDTEFSLLTDRFVLYDGVKLVAWTYGLITVLFTVILLVQGEPESIPPLLGMFALVLAGLSLLGVLIMLVVFRNRFRARHTITADGVIVESTSRTARFFNRFAVVAGAVGRSPGTAGAGLLAMSREQVGLEWVDLHRIKTHEDQLVLSLMNSWRVVMRLYCTPENYQTVLALVTDGAARGARQRQDEARTAGPSPYPRILGTSVLVLLAGALVAPTPFEISPTPVVIAIVAVLAAVWLPGISRVAGLVGLAAVVWAVVGVLAQGFEVHQLIPEAVLAGRPAPEWGSYSGWSTLDRGEWIRFCATAAGLTGLAIFSLAAITARFGVRSQAGTRPHSDS